MYVHVKIKKKIFAVFISFIIIIINEIKTAVGKNYDTELIMHKQV